jgi:hypothetical protein
MGLMGIVLAMLVASSAGAALREYRIEFVPSVSDSAVGYSMQVGTSSGNYAAEFDLGSPPASGATVVYAVDLFVALRSYDGTGGSSDYSNEIRVAAVVVDPRRHRPRAKVTKAIPILESGMVTRVIAVVAQKTRLTLVMARIVATRLATTTTIQTRCRVARS